MLLYIASDVPLLTIPWDATQPAFHVTNLQDARWGSPEVAQRFSKPHVYVVGSAEKCACLYNAGEELEPEEVAHRDAAVDSLRQYLAEAAAYSAVQIYTCWSGEEALPALLERVLQPATAGVDAFLFEPGTLVHVPRDSAV